MYQLVVQPCIFCVGGKYRVLQRSILNPATMHCTVRFNRTKLSHDFGSKDGLQ